jgi:hypothetical protein
MIFTGAVHTRDWTRNQARRQPVRGHDQDRPSKIESEPANLGFHVGHTPNMKDPQRGHYRRESERPLCSENGCQKEPHQKYAKLDGPELPVAHALLPVPSLCVSARKFASLPAYPSTQPAISPQVASQSLG